MIRTLGITLSLLIGSVAFAHDTPAGAAGADAAKKGGSCAACAAKHGQGQGHEGCCKGHDGKGCPMKVLNSDKVDLKVEDTPTGAVIRVNSKSTAPADLASVREAARSLSTCCPGGGAANPSGKTLPAPTKAP